MVQIPSACEAGFGDVVDDDDWAFVPAFQKEKKGRQRFLHLHLKWLKTLYQTCVDILSLHIAAKGISKMVHNTFRL